MNVASRVAELADSGEVLMTSVTREAVAGSLLPGQLRARGEHDLKNLRDPVSVFELIPEGGHSEEPLPIDPVCRMAVAPGAAEDSVVHGAIPYYFCSEECAAAFREHADRYTRD